MSIKRARGESGHTAVDASVMVMLMVVMLVGGTFVARWVGDSSAAEAAPARIDYMASQIDEEAKGLPEGTLVKSVYTQRSGFDTSSMEVSFNDSKTGDLKASRSIDAPMEYSSEVTGTVGDYTITYTGEKLEFTYDSSTGKTTEKELN